MRDSIRLILSVVVGASSTFPDALDCAFSVPCRAALCYSDYTNHLFKRRACAERRLEWVGCVQGVVD